MNGARKRKNPASQLVESKTWIRRFRNLDAFYEPSSDLNWETSGGNDLQLFA
jgi:hypothetical protein